MFYERCSNKRMNTTNCHPDPMLPHTVASVAGTVIFQLIPIDEGSLGIYSIFVLV